MKNKILKWAVSGLLMFLLCSSAWGAGIIFNCNGTGGSGYVYESGTTKLGAGAALQFIKGSKNPPDPKSNYLSGGNSLLGDLGKVGEGTGGENGTFNRVESLASGTVYVRAWNTPSPSQGKGVKYGYSGYGAASSGTAPPQPFPVPSFSLNYLAYAPEAPALQEVAKEEIGYDTATLKWKLAEGYEVTQVEILYGKAKTDNNSVDTSSGGTIQISGAPLSYKFPSYPSKNSLAPNNTYYAQVVAKNYFEGTPGKSNIVTFSTIAVPASEVGSVKNLSIKANHNDYSITLSYEGVNAAEFEVYRSVDQGKTWQLLAETGKTSYTDTAADTALAYYRVKAKNGVFGEATVAREILELTKLSLEGQKYTGINSVSLPFNPNGAAVDKNDQWNPTADGLANFIQKHKGKVVEFIGGWDRSQQKSFGRLYKEGLSFSGAEKAEDFFLSAGEGYQISVSEPIKIVLVGEVSGAK